MVRLSSVVAIVPALGLVKAQLETYSLDLLEFL